MKRFFLCLLTLFLSSPLFCDLPEGITIEGRFSYFLPASKRLRNLYHSGGINYELMGQVPIWQGINGWWAGDYFYRTGRSTLGDMTRIQIGSFTLGAKYEYQVAKFAPYGGLGLRYFFLHIKNHGSYVNPTVWKNGPGGVIEIGTLYTVIKHLVLDFYMSYSYKKFSPPHNSNQNVKTNSLNVGGWNFGGGIGYQF